MTNRIFGGKISTLILTIGLTIGFSTLMASLSVAALVAYWPLDEGNGADIADDTGNGHSGTFVGDPQWVDGSEGKALEFDGDDYVDVASFADVKPASITIAAWVYFNRTAGNRQDFISRGDDYAFTLGGHEQDERIHAVITAGGDWVDMIGDTVIEKSRWYHVALTFDDGTKMLSLYVDGQLDAEEEVPAGMEHRLGGTLTIGTYNDRYLDGKLDDIKVWDNALSEKEINEEMAPNPVEPAGKLAGLWGKIRASE